MDRNKSIVLALQLILWAACLFVISWSWDRWLLNGPHGPYRWTGMDFAPYWVGAREMLNGIDPYQAETTLKTQELVYGGPALGEDPMMFVYPAWMFILIAPFSLMPFQWAVILYSGSLLWGMLNFLFKIASSLGSGNFRAQAFWLIWLTIGSLPFLVISVTKGQLGYFSLLALFAAFYAREQKPYPAGVFLSLALIKPTVTAVPVAGFLLWALLKKDWKLLAGFSGSITVLLAGSFLSAGNWLSGYFNMLGINGGMPVLWSMEILPMPWNLLYAALFVGIMLFSSFISFKGTRDHWFAAFVLGGIALTPMRWIYDLFLGILILTSKRDFTPQEAALAGLAILSPWVLIFVPEAARWNTAVIGIPLVWAAYLVVSLFSAQRRQPQ